MSYSKQKSSTSNFPSKSTIPNPKSSANDFHKTDSLSRPLTSKTSEGLYATDSLPFTPVENPYEQIFEDSTTPENNESVSHSPNNEPKQLDPEDYLDQCYIDFGHSEKVLLQNDEHSSTPPHNTDDLKSLSQAELVKTTVVSTEFLHKINNNVPLEISHDEMIYDYSNNSRKLASCNWWKARSIQCSKCQVQPLRIRRRPAGGGYGIIRSTSSKGLNNNEKSVNDDQLKIDKVIPGLCSSCCPYSFDENPSCCGSGDSNSLVRKSNTRSLNRNVCNCTGKSEYQCAYAPPESQYLLRRHNRSGSVRDEVAYHKKLYKLLQRPPWNYSTSVPPPQTWVETIRTAEANLRALDHLIVSKEDKKKQHHHSCSNRNNNNTNCKDGIKQSPLLSKNLQNHVDPDCDDSISYDTETTEEDG